MTISIAGPEPVSSAPARFFGLLRSTVAAVGSQLARVLREAEERAQTAVRRIVAAAAALLANLRRVRQDDIATPPRAVLIRLGPDLGSEGPVAAPRFRTSGKGGSE